MIGDTEITLWPSHTQVCHKGGSETPFWGTLVPGLIVGEATNGLRPTCPTCHRSHLVESAVMGTNYARGKTKQHGVSDRFSAWLGMTLGSCQCSDTESKGLWTQHPFPLWKSKVQAILFLLRILWGTYLLAKHRPLRGAFRAAIDWLACWEGQPSRNRRRNLRRHRIFSTRYNILTSIFFPRSNRARFGSIWMPQCSYTVLLQQIANSIVRLIIVLQVVAQFYPATFQCYTWSTACSQSEGVHNSQHFISRIWSIDPASRSNESGHRTAQYESLSSHGMCDRCRHGKNVCLACNDSRRYKSNLVWKPVPCVCGVQLANCDEARLRRANDIASFDLAPRQKPGRPPIKWDDFTKFCQQQFPTEPSLDECNETLMWWVVSLLFSSCRVGNVYDWLTLTPETQRNTMQRAWCINVSAALENIGWSNLPQATRTYG